MSEALAIEPMETQVIKISSKRQITIPAKCYEEAGFGEYALCTWGKGGMKIEPLEVDDEDDSVRILRQLVSHGYEGEELIEKYKELNKKLISIKAKLDEAERDVAEGRVMSWDEMMKGINDRYGL